MAYLYALHVLVTNLTRFLVCQLIGVGVVNQVHSGESNASLEFWM